MNDLLYTLTPVYLLSVLHVIFAPILKSLVPMWGLELVVVLAASWSHGVLAKMPTTHKQRGGQ